MAVEARSFLPYPGAMPIRPESEWWYETARRDLGMAETLLRESYFEGTAFHSQQSAEKNLKGLLLERGESARTHSCVELLERLKALGEAVSEDLLEQARALDRDYVPSRYPNGVGGEPEKFYSRKSAGDALAQIAQHAPLAVQAELAQVADGRAIELDPPDRRSHQRFVRLLRSRSRLSSLTRGPPRPRRRRAR